VRTARTGQRRLKLFCQVVGQFSSGHDFSRAVHEWAWWGALAPEVGRPIEIASKHRNKYTSAAKAGRKIYSLRAFYGTVETVP